MAQDEEPSRSDGDDPVELMLGYLDYYRTAIERKLDGLPDAELTTTRLPSGWSPLELLKHLVFMERRWLPWGFAAEPIDDPWGDRLDRDPDQPWVLFPDDDLQGLVAAMHDGGRRTREIATGHQPGDRVQVGGRFTEDDTLPTLMWTLTHVMQEYARHAGHLDIARELADGVTGE